MKREFTTREKILLVIFVVLIISLGYFKLILEPINDQIDTYTLQKSEAQTVIDKNAAIAKEIKQMQAKIDAIKASGDYRQIPTYDNSEKLMVELHSILQNTVEYSLDFGTVVFSDGLVQRPVEMTYYTSTYSEARTIINALSQSDNLMQISDMNISRQNKNGKNVYRIYLDVTYYEVNVQS